MFSRLLSIVRRPFSDGLKGLSSWAASAFWWIADKAFGDTIFGGLKAMVGMASVPPWVEWGWAYGPPLLLFVLGIYFFRRSGTPGQTDAAPNAGGRTAGPIEHGGAVTPLPPQPVAFAAPTARVERAPQAPAPPPPDPDWSKLYELADDGQRVRLRFLPDTEQQEDDALLVLVFGHKALKGEDRLRVGAAYGEVGRAMVEAPNSPIPQALRFLYTLNRLKQQTALGQRHVDAGLLRVIGLSGGGALQLTDEGEVRAKQLAADLIRRA
jgi:hypothetical protein